MHLGGHRGLRTVIDRRKVADARFSVHFDSGEKSGLCRGKRHLDALRSQSVQPRDHSEQVCAQPLLRRAVCGVDNVVRVSMLA